MKKTILILSVLIIPLLGNTQPSDFLNPDNLNITYKKYVLDNGLRLDRPESEQSVIIAGYVTEPYGKVSEFALQSLMNVLGGDFISRINMNIREDKHWPYGAGAFVLDAKGHRPLLAFTSVQRDKSKESIEEILKEYRDFVGDRPLTDEEFERVRKNMVMQLPGRWETNGAVLSSVDEIINVDPDGNPLQLRGEIEHLER